MGVCGHGRQRSCGKECGGGGIWESGRRATRGKECRRARDAAARAIHPPVHPKPEILVELEDVEDPGEDDDERASR